MHLCKTFKKAADGRNSSLLFSSPDILLLLLDSSVFPLTSLFINISVAVSICRKLQMSLERISSALCRKVEAAWEQRERISSSPASRSPAAKISHIYKQGRVSHSVEDQPEDEDEDEKEEKEEDEEEEEDEEASNDGYHLLVDD
eukprot:207125-Hanusia_phi.AAC.1